jgi:hypothetical protein
MPLLSLLLAAMKLMRLTSLVRTTVAFRDACEAPPRGLIADGASADGGALTPRRRRPTGLVHQHGGAFPPTLVPLEEAWRSASHRLDREVPLASSHASTARLSQTPNSFAHRRTFNRSRLQQQQEQEHQALPCIAITDDGHRSALLSPHLIRGEQCAGRR